MLIFIQNLVYLPFRFTTSEEKKQLASCNYFSGVRLASGGKLHAEDKPQETAIFLILVILQLTGSAGFSSLFVNVATPSCIEITVVCAVSSMEQISFFRFNL